MEAIKITKEHKEKLIEIAKSLLPEPKYISLGDEDIMLLSKSKNPAYEEISPIHWFELCFTYLSHEVIFDPFKTIFSCEKSHSNMLKESMKLMYGEKGVHPVDYLYEEFLKLKQNKSND